MSTWESILKGSQHGAVRVTLPEILSVPKPRKRVGRPRIERVTPFGHYEGYRPEKGGRPRCEARSCGKWLKRTQKIGCCAEHVESVIREAKALLDMVQR